MKTGSFFSSNLFSLYNVIQNVQIIYPKELIIGTLREYFSKDTKYHYVKDEWGFPKTPDHTDLDPLSGLNDNETTRIYIGQENKFTVPFYPAVLVKSTSSTYVPISFNQEESCVQYEFITYEDGYGQKYQVSQPAYFIFAGCWDINLVIDVLTEGSQDRSTIVEAISVYLMGVARNQLTGSGLFIKSLRVDSESIENYQNDNIYKQSISLECKGEYRRHIPITDIAEIITICGEIGHMEGEEFVAAPNMTINHIIDADSNS